MSRSCSASWPTLGAPLLYAHFPRAYLDVNREPYELDPALFREACRITPIPNRCGWSAASAPLPASSRSPTRSTASRCRSVAALERINRLYTPYHATLKRAARRGAPGLRACRADRLPLHAVEPDGRPGRRPARTSSSATATAPPAARELTRARRRRQLKAQGYVVALNKPYAGGYITEHYGRPAARPPCPPGGDQPRALYERDDLRQIAGIRAASGAIWSEWRGRSWHPCRA